MLPLIPDFPDEAHGRPKCCSNSESVSVPVKAFARYVTVLPYMTPEWQAYYRSARNQMEGKNGFIKNPLGSNIAVPGERRFRGWAKQLLAPVVKVVAANFEAMLKWIDDEEDGKHTAPGATRGRPRHLTLREEFLPPDTGEPIRIIGEPAAA